MEIKEFDNIKENIVEVNLGVIKLKDKNEYKFVFPNTFDHKAYRITHYTKTCGCIGDVKAADMSWKHSKQFFDSENDKDLYQYDIEFSITKQREGDWVTDLTIHFVSEESTNKEITFRLFYTTKHE